MVGMRQLVCIAFQPKAAVKILLTLIYLLITTAPTTTANLYALNEVALRQYLEHILELGNVSSSINGSIKSRPPHYVQELYDVLIEDEDGYRYSRQHLNGLFTVQAICQDRHNLHNNGNSDNLILNFSLMKLWILAKHLARAELVLELRPLEATEEQNDLSSMLVDQNRHFTLNVYGAESLTINDEDFDFASLPSLLASRSLPVEFRSSFARRFMAIDLTRHVRHMLKRRQKRQANFDADTVSRRSWPLVLRLEITSTLINGSGPPLVSLLRPHVASKLLYTKSRSQAQPLLVLYSSIDSDSGGLHQHLDLPYLEQHRRMLRRRRRRRQTSHANDYDDEDDNGSDSHQKNSTTDLPPSSWNMANTCSLRSWPVDLDGLLLQRLMMPRMVNVNFCSGICPFPVYDSHWNATNNAVIRSSFITRRANLASSQSPAVPDPLCVPRTYSPMSFLFAEGNNYVFRRLEHVIATSCMCA